VGAVVIEKEGSIGEPGGKSDNYGAVWSTQSELFFRLLLKNTVCWPLTAAYANFWSLPSLKNGGQQY